MQGNIPRLRTWPAAAALVLGLAISRMAVGQDEEPVGAVLVYDVAPLPGTPAGAFDLDAVVEAFEKRINPNDWTWAEIRKSGPRQIALGVFGKRPARVAEIQTRLALPGTIEFRILANTQDHAALVKLAERESGAEVYDERRQLVARWVPVAEKQKLPAEGEANLVTRKKGAVREFLAVIDPLNVSQPDLLKLRADFDARMEPCLTYIFSAKGGDRMAQLTRQNLPDPKTGRVRYLGVIINGSLYAADPLHMRIDQQGEVDGPFTPDEAVRLAHVLAAGPLPAVIEKHALRKP